MQPQGRPRRAFDEEFTVEQKAVREQQESMNKVPPALAFVEGIIGGALFIVGIAMIFVPAAFIVGGAALMFLSFTALASEE